MSYRLIVASAHDTGLADKSVHLIVTSSPYLSLRSYSGNQAIEWPEVSYAPIAGMPEITIRGCAPACVHEWVDGPHRSYSGGTAKSLPSGNHSDGRTHFSGPQGAYCIHCGGWRGGLGSEPTIEAFIGHLILVLREMHRVLRDDGICFFNLGDSYTGSGGAHTHDHANPGISKSAYRDGAGEKRNLSTAKFHGGKAHLEQRRVVGNHGLRPKNLMMIPARFALAAQADGWIVRNDIIWAKPNPMPESVTDRCTKAHEYIFMLTKQENYYYDAEAIKEPATYADDDRRASTEHKSAPTAMVNGIRPRTDKQRGHGRRHAGFNERWDGMTKEGQCSGMRNKRDVWTIATQPYEGAHFACFPAALPEICIRSGTSEAGVCPHCGKQWRRCVELGEITSRGGSEKGRRPSNNPNTDFRGGSMNCGEFVAREHITTGWQPSCSCPAHDPIPATVLDPFVGSGTTCQVAQWLGRDSIGLDLSDEYHQLAHERINTPRERVEDRRAPADGQMGLFEEFAL